MTTFSPTPAMRRYARACVSPEVRPDSASRCESAGVNGHTVARWEASAAFHDWLEAEIHRLLKQQAWEVWAVVNALARHGNLTAAKLLLDRFSPALNASEDEGAESFLQLAHLAETLPEDPQEEQAS